MLKVVSVEEMRALERAVEALGLPSAALLENAGRAVADAIVAKERPAGRRALVLVGPGNNGGDGLVAARHLHDAGVAVSLYLIGRSGDDDAKIRLLQQRDVPFYLAAQDPDLARLDVLLDGSDLVVDAVLGTGRARPIAEPLASILERVNRRRRRQAVVALDLPTGVNADSGAVDPRAVRASWTVTLGFPKRGLLMGEAVEHVGELVVADIGIPTGLAADLPIRYATAAHVAALLPERPRASNKGTFGRVLIVAGSQLYTGAPVLAALGAERIGAGLVTLACPASVRPSLAAHTLETTFLPVPDDGSGAFAPRSIDALSSAFGDYRAVLVGPGIGRASETSAFLAQLLPRLKAAGRPVVFDADALTLLAELPRFWEQLPAGSVLTPHPGEMSRLVGGAPLEDRLAGARTYARQWGSVVVLKGAYSVVASPGGTATVLPFANPTLATAGTGDVLAGAILGLLGQGLSSEDAAVLGGFVHGAAGGLVRDAIGSAGALAGEVARELPRALNVVREAPRALSGQPSTW